MKYFLDFEFIEGFDKPLFCKKRHFIDMISVGIVCEDGREYYGISTEFNPKDANDWVRKNVISKLPDRHVDMMDSPRRKMDSILWKPEKQIVDDIYKFFGYKPEYTDYGSDMFTDDNDIQVYGYYADYDWVLLCSLFGRMINLPKGFPMYCIDLKQHLDEAAIKIPAAYNKEQGLISLKQSDGYPKQSDEHNALADAKWNYELYKFLQTL